MRKIAAFRFDLSKSNPEDFVKLSHVVDSWFEGKGEISTEIVGDFVLFKANNVQADQRALYKEDLFECSIGSLKRYVLREEREIYHLRTTIELSIPNDENLTIYIQIEYESVSKGAPSRLTIRRPRLITDIINAFPDKLGDIPNTPFDFHGEDDLHKYLNLFFNTRNHPLVVLSHCDENESDWSEKLLDELAYDLAGTAFVCRIDQKISWKLSETAGNQWSCFNGGIRVFWPDPKKNNYPFHHPLWTAEKIRRRGKDTTSITESVCNLFRKNLIMDLSPYSVIPPKSNLTIVNKSQEERFENKIRDIRGHSLDASTYEEMLREYEHELNKYKDQIRNSENDIAMLQYQLEELNKKSLSETSDSGGVNLAKTVSEIVQEASIKFGSTIQFAAKIDKSISSLALNAGPPEKIFEYFEKLDILAEELISANEGGIGKTILKWLTENGVKCSAESETTKNHPKYKTTHTFSMGDVDVLFDKHMKLGDATDKKHCVRIYFEWDPEKQKFLVGYIGEHLEI